MFKVNRFLLHVLIISSLLKPLYDFPDFLFGLNVIIIHKIICIFFLISITIYILNFKELPKICKLLIMTFFLGFLYSFINGVIQNSLSNIFISHSYYYIMPIFSIIYGYYLAKDEKKLKDFLNKIKIPIIYTLIFAFLLYLIFHHYLNIWNYFGYTTGFIFAIVITDKYKSYLPLGIYFCLDLLSGKRSSIFLWIIYFLRKIKFSPSNLLILIIIFLIFLLIIVMNIDHLPSRYKIFFTGNIFNYSDLVLMSGGRNDEWIHVYNLFINKPSSIFLGNGIGIYYTFIDPFGFDEVRHYSHLTISTYAMISGVPFALILYFLIFCILVLYRSCNFKYAFNYFYLYFALSFFGASLLVEPLPWVMFGMLFSPNNIKNSTI